MTTLEEIESEEIEYGSIDGLSRSMMVLLLKSPRLFYKTYMTQEVKDKSSHAMTQGTLKHMLLLEPEKFENTVQGLEEILIPKESFAEIKGNLKWRIIEEKSTKGFYSVEEPKSATAKENMLEKLKVLYGTKHVVLPSDYLGIKRQVDALQDNPYVKEMLEANPQKQSEITLTGTLFDVPVKARLDLLLNEYSIIDYKTTDKSINPKEFAKDMISNGLDIQCTLYQLLQSENLPRPARFLFLLQNNKSYESIVLEPDHGVYEHGLLRIKEAINIYKHCLEENEWPEFMSKDTRGYSMTNRDSLFPLSLPYTTNKGENS